MSELLPLLTQGEVRCHRRCRRERFYSYVLGFKSTEDAAPLSFGKWFDAEASRVWDAKSAKVSTPLTDPWAAMTAAVLLAGYRLRWAEDGWQSVGQHVEFRAPLVNPETGAQSRTYDLGGEMDGVAYRTRDDQVFILERKTTSEDLSLGSDYWRRLRIDVQISTYYVGARALGYEPAGVLYDVVKKPTMRPFKATPPELRKHTKATKTAPVSRLYANQHEADETPEEWATRLADHVAENPDNYFARGEVVRLEDEERDAAFDMWQTAREIAESDRLKRYPRNADACVRWGRTCSYFDVCTGAASIEDETRFRRAERRHEELSQ